MIGNNNAAASYLDVRRMPCNVLIDSPHSEREEKEKKLFSARIARFRRRHHRRRFALVMMRRRQKKRTAIY
jgi:hypothetical protein